MRAGQRFFYNFIICSLLSLSLSVFQASASFAASIASLRNVNGVVDIMKNGALPAVAAKNGEQLSTGDLIRTKSNSFAEVVYHDGTVLKVAQRSRIDIGEHFSGKNPNGGEVNLARGKVQALVDLSQAKGNGSGPKKFEIRTPNAIAGVRGTDLITSHHRGVTSIYFRSGSGYTYNPRIPGQVVNLTAGTVSTVTGQNPPTQPRPAQRGEMQRMEQGLTAPSGSGPGASNGSSGGAGTGTAGGTGATGSAGGTSGGGDSGGSSGGSSSGVGTPGTGTSLSGGTSTSFMSDSPIMTLPTTLLGSPTGGVSTNLVQTTSKIATQTTTNSNPVVTIVTPTPQPPPPPVVTPPVVTPPVVTPPVVTPPTPTTANVKIKVNF